MNLVFPFVSTPVRPMVTPLVEFSPKNIAGLVLWLDSADDTTFTLSGPLIEQWDDKSGNGNDVTPSEPLARPLRIPTIGKKAVPAVIYTGATNLLTASALLTDDAYEVFTVVNAVANAGSDRVIASQFTAAGTGRMSFFSEGGSDLAKTEYHDGTSLFSGTNTIPVFDNPVGVAFHAVCYSGDGTGNHSIFVDRNAGETVISGGGTFTPLSTPFSIGAYQDRTSGFIGSLGDIIVYNKQLTDADRATVMRFLLDKYGF
ncbi:hypothetical protein KAR91_25335 [Candidatus Pacearchaeota archaeon]|nr:hypothetical protein [Candidatus Pacearchaeota archaeon]